MKVLCEITIDAPIEKVFKTFTNLDILELNLKGIQELDILQGPAQMEVGTRWKETRLMFGKIATEEMWVTKIENNKNCIIEAESHGTHYTSNYIFVSKDRGTLLKQSFEGEPLTLPAKIMSPIALLMKKSLTRMLYQDMLELKTAIEEKR